VSHETDAPEATSTEVDPARERPAGRRRRRRGAAFWTGLLFVAVGFVLLGYVAWQFYGTNIVSRQAQQRVIDEITQEWSEDWSVAPQTTLSTTEEPKVATGKAMGLIRIPAFGDDYVVPLLQGVTPDVLSTGFGHFPHSALPGGEGNLALAAHRVTHGEPLRDMPELRPGDEVIVETQRAIYTYELDTNPNDLIVTFEDVWVVDEVPTNPDGGVEPPSQEKGQHLITLTTCAELFHTDNRMIAFGHLVDTEPKQASATG
jgi:sortase A